MLSELLMAGGGGLLNMLSGGSNMTPEQKRLRQMLLAELGVTENVQGQIDAEKQNLTTSANEINASQDASMARRGMPLSPGQTELAHADTNASFGKALSTAIPQIQQNAKANKMQIYSQLAGITPMGSDNSDFLSGLGELGTNLAYSLNKPKEPTMPNSYGIPQLDSGLSIFPQKPRGIGGWTRNPFTGKWERY
jgi:hypothetical protein